MGKQFLTFIYLLGIFWLPPFPLAARELIELMPPPVVIIPPPLDPDLSKQDLEQKRRLRQKREKKTGKNNFEHEKQKLALAKEAEKERSYTFMSQVSLVLPTIVTSGQRSRYTTDLTSHFSTFFRLNTQASFSTWQVWTGFRLAPFAGTGTYGRTPARYGFTYFGPMIGLGRVGRVDEKDKDQTAIRSDAPKPLTFLRRHGWFLMTGIAAQSRIVALDPTSEPAAEDMNSRKGAGLDGSGLWAELTYSVIHFGAVGTHYVAGIQLGQGKAFMWLGVAAGAWY